jgi:hypothetical protein
MKEVKLQKTSDYSIFKANEINRVLVDSGEFTVRKDLLMSMKQDGFKPGCAISCTIEDDGKLTIFDGHNRFATARLLGIPIYYFAFPKEMEVSPLDYSRDQKRWTLAQKAQAYAQNSADYAEVMTFHETTGIDVGSATSMFYGDIASSGNAAKYVNQGKFKIKDRDNPWRVAAIVRTLGKHCNFSTAKLLVSAVSKSVHAEGFDDAHMIERINRFPELITRCRTTEEYLEMLENIYNRHGKGKRYYLCTEVDKAMHNRKIGIANPAKRTD